MRLTALAAANGVSAAGETLTVVALMLVLQGRPDGSFAVAALVLLGLLPSVFLGPMLAPLLDRLETSVVLVVTLAFRCVVGVALAFAVDVPWILLLVGIGSVVSAIDSPALMLLVPPAQKPGANPAVGYARMDAFRSVGVLVGPAAAGLLVDVLGIRLVLLVDAATYGLIASVIAVLGVRRRPPAQKAQARPSWFRQVRVGPAALRQNRTVATAVIALAAAILFTSLITVAEVDYATTVLQAPAAVYGALVSVRAVGRLAAATLVAPRLPARLQPAALGAGGLLMGIALLALGLAPSIPLAFVGLFLVGAANALQSIAIRSIVVGAVETGEQGRAFAAVIALNNASTMAGTAAAAPLVALAGPAATLAIAGAGTLAATVPALGALRSRTVTGAPEQS